MKRLAILAAAASALAGCASFSTMSTARTVERDQTQMWIAPEFVGMTIDTGTSNQQAIAVPQFEFGFRRGITDGAEIGAKLWLLGAAIESKFQLVRAATQDAGIDVAIAPGIGWLGFNSKGDDFNVVTGYLSLPVGINIPGGSQLVLTPKGIYQRYMARGPNSGGSSGDVTLMFVGGSAGFAWKLGTSYILPELSIMKPVLQGSQGDAIYYKGVVFQGGIGLLFGGEAPRPVR
jgi:hypothetical protein